MNQESTDQLQGQESASLTDTTTTSYEKADTVNIQLPDKVTEDCNLNLTSSPQISDSHQVSCEAQKSLIRNLYNLLMCEKLPATDESLNLSSITNEVFSETELAEANRQDKEIDEFIEFLEVLCDKIKGNDSAENHNKIEEMNKNIQKRIDKIKSGKSVKVLLIKEDNLKNIAQKWENLKTDEIMLKILFHKSNGNGTNFFSVDNEVFKSFKTGNQKFILKDLCEIFEGTIVPKTQELLSTIEAIDNLTWETLSNNIKSTILKSFIEFQGFYIPLQELTKNNPEKLECLNSQQIFDIIKNGFTKVSKIQQLSIPFYIKRYFILEHMETYVRESYDGNYMEGFGSRQARRDFIESQTRTYDDLKKELKSKRILVLTDAFESGKTSTLKYFARKLKEESKKMWISYIDTKLSSKLFEGIGNSQDLTIDKVTDILVEILGLNAFEKAIFKYKFERNEVILLWDNFDYEFQEILIDFTWNINQLTKNQQVLTTRFRFSKKLAEKFNITPYKFMPYKTHQIVKFHERTQKFMNLSGYCYFNFLRYCDSIGIGVEGQYYFTCDILINSNIKILKMVLLAAIDLQIDIDYCRDTLKIYDKVFKKQLMDCPEKMTENEVDELLKFLQVHAVKSTFGDELTKSIQLVKKCLNVKPQISSLDGVFIVNYDDNSVDFQHEIYKKYFVMKFIMEYLVCVNTNDIKVTEAKKLITIFTRILVHRDYTSILELVKSAFHLKYRNPTATKEVQDNLFKIIKKAQYWTKVTKNYSPKELKHIVHDNKLKSILDETEFWGRLHREIKFENDKIEIKLNVKQHKEVMEVKSSNKEQKNKPSVKGITSIKKLNSNHEISHQMNEFLDDFESDESD